MPFRASRDAATSRGLRIGDMTHGCAPILLTASIQNLSKRHIRGSFSTNSRLSPNSFKRTACARSRYSSATGETYQFASKALQSLQTDPADARISSFRSVIGWDSQWPVGLSPAGFIRVAGKSHPTRPSKRVNNDVPLRCIPATRTATLPSSRGISDSRTPLSDVLRFVQCVDEQPPMFAPWREAPVGIDAHIQ